MKNLLGFIILLFCCSSAIAAGSGAFRVELPDAAAMGMGSAFVGEADSASAVYYNPAGLTQIEGNEVIVGATLLQPFTDYKTNAGAETEMQPHKFMIPHFYFVSDLGIENVKFGMGAGSNWGSSTEWADDSFSKYAATKSELTTQDYYFTAAYELNDQWSLAVAADYNRVDVDKNKKLYQATNDGHFNLNGEGDAWGYRLAAHFKLNERHKFGFMYRSSMQHKIEGTVNLTNLNSVNVLNGGTASYAGLAGGSSLKTATEIKLELPQSLLLGYSHTPNDKWTINADLEWMDWSSIRDELLTYPDPNLTAGQKAVLAGGNPVYHDWNSVFSFGIGAEYKASENLRLRTGYYFHESPIPDDTYESSLPDADSHSITIGAGYDIRKNLTLDVAYSAMFQKDRVIDNTVGDAAQSPIDGEYSTWISMLLASVKYSF